MLHSGARLCVLIARYDDESVYRIINQIVFAILRESPSEKNVAKNTNLPVESGDIVSSMRRRRYREDDDTKEKHTNTNVRVEAAHKNKGESGKKAAIFLAAVVYENDSTPKPNRKTAFNLN